MKNALSCLNLGCGSRYIKEWTNIDFASVDGYVQSYNLTKPLPFKANTFDVVYSSHLLEHFSKEDAVVFISECQRVLKPNGILRVVVPDLEYIARCYLDSLQQVLQNDSEQNKISYFNDQIELLDQHVRTTSGGNMLAFWKEHLTDSDEFLKEKYGEEYTRFKSNYLKSKKSRSVVTKIKNRLYTRLPFSLKQAVDSYNYRKFRQKGELHQWMYDAYSLMKLLEMTNFTGIRKVDAFTSEIPGWDQWQYLDVENGTDRKPHSLFMEGRKCQIEI